MINRSDFYKSLFFSQKIYLIALHEFANLHPSVCCDLFDMKSSHVSVMVSHSEDDWAGFVSGLKSWILTPRKDITNTCLFNYWLNNIHAEKSIANQINSRIALGKKISQSFNGLETMSRCQSSILMNICMCVEFDPLFAKGLLFLSDSTINTIQNIFPVSNKLHFNELLLPLFVLNRNLDFTKLMSLGAIGYANVEQSLFTMAS